MKRIIFSASLSGLLVLLFLAWSVQTPRTVAAVEPNNLTDVERINHLLDEMRTIDLDKLQPLPVQPFNIPNASVDVMRVRLEETYEVEGIGRDTVQLTGWIAAKINDPRPAPGETEIKWGTAISDTEFIGMELHGNSPKFGPVIVRINRNLPSKGQVGALSFSMTEALALDRAYRPYRETNGYTAVPPEMREPVETPAASAHLTADDRAIKRIMDDLWDSLERKDATRFTKDFAADFDYPGSARPGAQVNNRAEYIADLRDQLKNVQSLDVRSQAPRITVLGRQARVSASGSNAVTPKEGEGGSAAWRASVFLRKVGKTWKITQNQIRFKVDDDTGNITPEELKKRAASCRASLSIEVEMPSLDLKMKSASPVVWYSEVQTIPPVGYTASVSLTPTPMLSGDRKVAMLEHGAVKFREIVRHIELQGANITRLYPR